MSNNHFTAHPGFYNQPIRLTTEEQAQPLEVVRAFFQNCHLGEVRQTLWQAFEAALTTDSSVYDDAEHRSHLLWFYRELECSLEAGWLLCKEGVYQKAKFTPTDPAPAPHPVWPSKADLEQEIHDLKLDNLLKENELNHLRFFKAHGRLMTDPEPAQPV